MLGYNRITFDQSIMGGAGMHSRHEDYCFLAGRTGGTG